MSIPELPTSVFVHPDPSAFGHMIDGIDPNYNLLQFFRSLRHIKLRREHEQHYAAFQSDLGPKAYSFKALSAVGMSHPTKVKFALEIRPLPEASALATGIVAELRAAQQKAIDEATGAGRRRKTAEFDVKTRFLTVFRETWLDCKTHSPRFCRQAASQLGIVASSVVTGEAIDVAAVKMAEWLKEHEFECAPREEILSRIQSDI